MRLKTVLKGGNAPMVLPTSKEQTDILILLPRYCIHT